MYGSFKEASAENSRLQIYELIERSNGSYKFYLCIFPIKAEQRILYTPKRDFEIVFSKKYYNLKEFSVTNIERYYGY